MRKPTRTFQTLYLFPVPTTHVLILSRSRSLSELWLSYQKLPENSKPVFLYSADDLYPYRDKQETCLVVVIYSLTDSLHFREAAGREFLFFRNKEIIRELQ